MHQACGVGGHAATRHGARGSIVRPPSQRGAAHKAAGASTAARRARASSGCRCWRAGRCRSAGSVKTTEVTARAAAGRAIARASAGGRRGRSGRGPAPSPHQSTRAESAEPGARARQPDTQLRREPALGDRHGLYGPHGKWRNWDARDGERGTCEVPGDRGDGIVGVGLTGPEAANRSHRSVLQVGHAAVNLVKPHHPQRSRHPSLGLRRDLGGCWSALQVHGRAESAAQAARWLPCLLQC